MSAETKEGILRLQDRLKAGEISAEEYMVAVARLTDPEKADGLETDYLLATLPDYSFQYDDDDTEPNEIAEVTRTTNKGPIALVSILIIFAVTILLTAALWVMIRAATRG